MGEVITGLGAGLGIFKSLYDSAKALKDINDASVRNGAVIELQEKILAAQEAQSSLVNRVSELEKQVTQLKDWDTDKKRYQLANIGKGIVALALKPAMSNGEPMHYLCADCAAKGQKSYLQPHIRGSAYEQYKCNGCGFEIGIDKDSQPSGGREPIDEDPGGDFMTR
jgi:DNA-directed RNA polymerase subunit RPC12/RpoP